MRIWFLRNQSKWNTRQEAGDHQVGPGGRPAIVPEELREHERDTDLRKLRRLQVEELERNPAARTHLHRAEKHHVHEHPEERQVNQQ
jgi:hypothetical protein